MKRVVLDTSVMVSAFRSRNDASHRLLGMVAERRLLFLEYEDVLKRPEQRLVSGLGLARVDAVLAALAAAIEPVEVRFAWRPQLPDPDDERVLDAAVNGQADAMVTHNLAGFTPAAAKFGVRLLRPAELLERRR